MNDANQCVCDANYYENGTTSDNAPNCTACPVGSTTGNDTDVKDITGCSMYNKII